MLKLIFTQFLGSTAPLVSMMALHIPSAKEGTKTKVEQNYTGDKTTDVY